MAEVELRPGVTVFTGRNGQGKTNLVEALEYLAKLSSHRVSADLPLIRAGASRAIVRATIQAGVDDPRQLQAEIEIHAGKANKASLNRGPLRRPRDLLGALRVVLFAPDDLALIKGDPSVRRRFLDELITARWPRLAGVIADYERVLKQRSSLLKTAAKRRGPLTEDVSITLDIFDEQLADVGAEILLARLETLVELGDPVAEAYRSIAPSNNQATMAYKSSSLTGETNGLVDLGAWDGDLLRSTLLHRMKVRRSEEVVRGVTLVGPHRDDIVLSLGDFPAKGYASHGESWSYALALRLGSKAVLKSDGVSPVLILDDVFAELDEVRRLRLAELIADAEQVIITVAVPSDVPEVLAGRRFIVEHGQVSYESG